MDKRNYCVILAGGLGSRLWPMSREKKPKQFIDVLGTGKTLLQMTYDRFAGFIDTDNIIIVTNVYGDPVAGYPTIMVTVLFLGGAQLICIGVIGEYLARVFNESKRRPGYFVSSYNGNQPMRRANDPIQN